MKVKRDREVAQSCPTLSDPMDCSPPGSSTRGIFQARVLEWGAIARKKLVLSKVPLYKKNKKFNKKKKYILYFLFDPASQLFY